MIHNLFGYILNLIELAVILVDLLDKKKYAKICPPPPYLKQMIDWLIQIMLLYYNQYSSWVISKKYTLVSQPAEQSVSNVQITIPDFQFLIKINCTED